MVSYIEAVEAAQDRQLKLQVLVREWRDARTAIISSETGDPDFRPKLNRLSEAEDALFQASKQITL